jgi:hypothetical protein
MRHHLVQGRTTQWSQGYRDPLDCITVLAVITENSVRISTRTFVAR